MRKYRIVTVHRVVQTIEREHTLEADGLAEVSAWLAQGDLPYLKERVQHSERMLLEAHIADVTNPQCAAGGYTVTLTNPEAKQT